MSTNVVIRLSDTGPLITLAYADALDVLLLPGRTVQMVDLVLHEVTRNQTPTSPAKLSCDCAHCDELSRFLADAFQGEWRYKAGEPRRRHLEESIRKSQCDIDCHTEKKGRPIRWCVGKIRTVTTVGKFRGPLPCVAGR